MATPTQLRAQRGGAPGCCGASPCSDASHLRTLAADAQGLDQRDRIAAVRDTACDPSRAEPATSTTTSKPPSCGRTSPRFRKSGLLPGITSSLAISCGEAGQLITVFGVGYALLAPLLARLVLTGGLLVFAAAKSRTASQITAATTPAITGRSSALPTSSPMRSSRPGAPDTRQPDSARIHDPEPPSGDPASMGPSRPILPQGDLPRVQSPCRTARSRVPAQPVKAVADHSGIAGHGHVFPGRAAGELAWRPGSVHPLSRAGGHLSGTAIAGSILRSTRELGRAALERSRRPARPRYAVGFSGPSRPSRRTR